MDFGPLFAESSAFVECHLAMSPSAAQPGLGVAASMPLRGRQAIQPLHIKKFIEKLQAEIPDNAVVSLDKDDSLTGTGILRFAYTRTETDHEYQLRLKLESEKAAKDKEAYMKYLEDVKREYERLKLIIQNHDIPE